MFDSEIIKSRNVRMEWVCSYPMEKGAKTYKELFPEDDSLIADRQEFFDELHSSEEEQRYITIGRLPGKFLVVLVVSTDQNGITRIISARYASKKEEQLYYG